MIPLTETTKMLVGKDINGIPTYGIRPPMLKYTCNMLQGFNYRFSTPSENNEYHVVFSYEPGASVWVSIDEPADGAVIDIDYDIQRANCELNPTVRIYPGKKWIYLKTDNASALVFVGIYASFSN